MTIVNKNQNSAYGFIAPDITSDADRKTEVVFPTQETIRLGSLAVDTEVFIKRAATVVELTLTDDITLTGVLSSDLKVGDTVLLVITASGDTRTLSLDLGLGDKDIEVAEDDTVNVQAVFAGASFNVVGIKGDEGEPGEDAVIEDNSIVPAKLQKGVDDAKTYTLKSVAGVVQWVEDSAE